ncbi:MAG: hypothetical protein ACM3S5_19495 [Rhodospirillales bacterium]
MPNVTSGRHQIYDCLWYTAFENSDPLDSFELDGTLKEGKTFKTHDAFLGLLTFLHESSHFIQSHRLGICAWVQMNADQTAISIHALAKLTDPSVAVRSAAARYRQDRNSFAIWAEDLPREREFLDDVLYSSRVFDRILDAEIRAHPSVAPVFKLFYGLTGQDLPECHAAIMTERRIALLLAQSPGAFSNVVLEDMASSFRPDQMPSCQKALRIFEHLTAGIRFERANKQHPLYPHCTRPAEYGLLLFLLDFALHACPLPKTAGSGGSDLQDVVPAARFLKLAGSVMPCILAMEDRSEFTLDEHYFHTGFMKQLVAFIRRCNELGARPGSAGAESFLSYDEISRRWISLFEEISKLAEATGVRDLFELFHRARIRSMEGLLKNPLSVYRTDVLALALELGLYPCSAPRNGSALRCRSFSHKKHCLTGGRPTRSQRIRTP